MSLEITGSKDPLTFLGATTRLTTTVRDADGRPVSDPVEWRSTDIAVATVADGLVTAVDNGSTIIIASSGELSDSVTVVVRQVATQLSVEPRLRRFESIGETRSYQATFSDQGGTPIDRPVEWSSNDPAVASVDDVGVVTAVGNGTAGITITQDDVFATFQVGVAAPVTIVNASVIPMTANQVLTDHTVITRNGLIQAVGPSGQVSPPSGSFVVDGTGKFLMPGLADAHVHFTCRTGAQCRNDLFLYLANGVTSIRSMWGSPFQLIVKNEVETGITLGPSLYVASPGIDGPGGGVGNTPIVNSVSEARSRAQSHVADGYGYLKIYNTLSMEMYQAIVEVGQSAGVSVLGHKPFAVPFSRLFQDGHLTAEHLLGYEQEAASTGSIWSSEPDAAVVTALAREASAAGVAETPTTTAFTHIIGEVNDYRSAPEARYVSDGVLSFSTTVLPAWSVSDAQRSTRLRRQRDIIRILHQEGVPLLLGTDAGVRWVFPGFSIHRELDEMVASGLTPYQALLTGTVNAATYFEAEGTFGTVEPGRRADLILLNANPLESVDKVEAISAVMVRGVWIPLSKIGQRLEEIATQYGR